MKRVGFIVLALLAAAAAHAWEIERNPDRYPSIGLDLYKGQLAGLPRAGVAGAQTTGGTVGGILDLRLPVTGSLTWHAFASSEGAANNKDFTDGYRVGMGFRVYMHD